MKRFLLAGGVAATNFIWQVEAALGATDSEKQPVNLPLEQAQEQATGGSSNSGGLGRTLVGLIVVVAIIYGLYWILKQVKKAREEQASGSGLHSLASLPLGPNRSLHMIRAGREIVLVGVAEHGVQPIRAYTEEEAFEAGLIDDDSDDGDDGDDGSSNGSKPKSPAEKAGFASPGQAFSAALTNLRERTVRK
jgi:flagellar protein FliO/FliZ